ncbi:hypothetical protein K469DRAFT_49887 [Zopfia rhizophila CBS 207.26]|uniref:Heterokaryon incompatibility domain-containing protein n=1 Tax=Zopfia rhizophila CBS 207.26 TaxID=1314779 RepID=A0A6A6EIE4_9PEZI|nr:hypothetical protein K469DRAFT_49887 [Zopfia rhizophila CBS 207.26]
MSNASPPRRARLREGQWKSRWTRMYSTLTGNKSFRLLYLYSHKRSSRIRCRLMHVSLEDHPPYEALSYEWKKHEGLTDILCESSTIEVTLNLASALDMLRHPSRERVLWVDVLASIKRMISRRERKYR